LEFVSLVDAQVQGGFAAGERERVTDLLTDLGCIGNVGCTTLGDFGPTTVCEHRSAYLRCNAQGFVEHMCVVVSLYLR
jgi:hypothetical protein